MQRPIIIGTRGSPLALYQARLVQSLLKDKAGVASEIKTFTTSGDKLTGELSQFGGKGLFTKELETALQEGMVDMAVHSMKDVPTQHQDGLKIGAVIVREDPRDAFISLKYKSLTELPQGANVGTASLRRRAQLSHIRPDIKFSLLRGNVGTRLDKLKSGDCDATFLAYAGLKRLELNDTATQIVSAENMLNAPAQGAIGIEMRVKDSETEKHVAILNHEATELAIVAERAFLRALDGSCRTPIAALGKIDGDILHFKGEVYSIDGKLKFSRETRCQVSDKETAYAAGFTLGRDIRTEIGDKDIWDGQG